MGSDYNAFDEGWLNDDGSNRRELVFTPPTGVMITVPSTGGIWTRYDQATQASQTQPLTQWDTRLGWTSPQTNASATCPDGTTAHGTVNVAGLLRASLYVQTESTLADALDKWVKQLGYPVAAMNYSASASVDVTMKIKNGHFDGNTVKLKGQISYGSTIQPQNAACGSAYGELFLAIAWGNDPWGNKEYLLIWYQLTASVDVDKPGCLACSTVSSMSLNEGDPFTYMEKVMQDMQSQITSGTAYLQGAIPDLLYLYDFSAANTTALTNTVPPSALVAAPMGLAGWTNLDGYINQYDAGPAFNLPVVDGAAGGAACGPTSLMMEMNATGHPQLNCSPIYNSTMTNDLFQAETAVAWLTSQGIRAHLLYADTEKGTLNGITNAWKKLNGLLTAKQPVVFRTDLSGTFVVGDGHFILLLGKGFSSDIAALYGTSGNYYIAADPAGDWYADQGKGDYAKVATLRQHHKGVNYGGWGAIYPVEFLMDHISDPGMGTGVVRITRVTIGQPPSSYGRVSVHSPVLPLVTDPFGNRIGFLPDGSFINEIQDSVYVPDVEDTDNQLSSVSPYGPKMFLIDHPTAGTYQVSLLGTNTGPVTLDWEQGAADGTVLASTNYTTTASLGSLQTYSLVAVTNGPPPMHVANQGNQLVISWPTNYAGFVLQAAASLAMNGWSAVTNATVVARGLNTISAPISGASQFFRLADQ